MHFVLRRSVLHRVGRKFVIDTLYNLGSLPSPALTWLTQAEHTTITCPTLCLVYCIRYMHTSNIDIGIFAGLQLKELRSLSPSGEDHRAQRLEYRPLPRLLTVSLRPHAIAVLNCVRRLSFPPKQRRQRDRCDIMLRGMLWSGWSGGGAGGGVGYERRGEGMQGDPMRLHRN